MSDLGSFVTEHITCPECFAVMRDILLTGFEAVEVTPHQIIAGRIKGLNTDQVFQAIEDIEHYAGPRLCHHVHVVVMDEFGEEARIITVMTDEQRAEWRVAGRRVPSPFAKGDTFYEGVPVREISE